MLKKIVSVLILFCLFIPGTVFADRSGLWLTEQYSFGGADGPYYTPESYYAAPVVKDLNGDGCKEIIFGNYAITVLDGATGNVIWKVNGGNDRSRAYTAGNDVGVVNDLDVVDIDKDGTYEVITVHGNGVVSVLSHAGYFEEGWPRQLFGENGVVYASARSLEVSDLNNDGYYEIIVGAATYASENVWVFDAWGEVLPGWPQLERRQDALYNKTRENGYSYGVFMDGVTAGDITGDNIKEVIVTTDTAYICAYDIRGKLVPANKEYYNGRTWGKVALWESEDVENDMSFNEGWGWATNGKETRARLYKGELGHAVAKVVDIDNNGLNEVITSAVILNRHYDRDSKTGDYNASRYMSFFIFNGDRTRYYGWEESPSDKNFMGAPVAATAKTLSSNVQAEPVIADLDNDGTNEIIINTYDGCVHAFSVDNPRKEFKNFPFKIQQTYGVVETPTGVVCKDVDGDGTKEVIFATYTDDRNFSGSHHKKGSVYVLNSDGTWLTSITIADGYKRYETQRPAYTNSVHAKPCVEDVDNDGVYEIVVNTRFSGIAVYEIAQSKTVARAVPNDATILLGGKRVEVSAYRINGYNYFKLRDIAMMVNGSKRQFSINYDHASNTVKLNRGQYYKAVGGEMAPISNEVKQAHESMATIMNKAAKATYSPYLIDGNNYFKLRDISQILGMEVDWNSSANSVEIFTD